MILYRYLLLYLMLEIHSISGQICRKNDIPDFFYNVDFTGPIFDQAVYTVFNLNVSTPVNTSLFTFTVKPQTNFTVPSYLNPTTVSSRMFDINSENITVTSTDPNFAVQKSNDIYSLVTNTSPLNYFSPFNRYLFQLIAIQTFSDLQRPSFISRVTVQINLKNDNAHAPIFTPHDQTFYISETAERYTQFGTVYATDADNDEIEYSLMDNTALFSINPLTGVLRLERSISPSQSEYFLLVIARDDGSSCLPAPRCSTRSSTTQIHIIITAVNRNSPQFLYQLCGRNISLYENEPNGKMIISLAVFDDDRGDNGLIDISFPPEDIRTIGQYRIEVWAGGLRNTAYSQFYIEQFEQIGTTRRAELRTNESFDYDRPGAPHVWYLIILATDRGHPQRQSFCSLTINLLDLNDNAPEFLTPTWNITIYNSSLITKTMSLLRLVVSDADFGVNSKINYRIGTPNVPYFTIERDTGKVFFRSDIVNLTSLDLNRFPIRFDVYAQDSGIPILYSQNNATIIINYSHGENLTPAKWLDPMFDATERTIYEKYYERQPNESFLNISYQLPPGVRSLMTVNSPFVPNSELPFRDAHLGESGTIFTSGIIVTSGLHAEIQQSYFLYVRVRVNPPLIGSFTVNVVDENDQIPTFDIRSIVLSVTKDESGRRIIAQIQAFDRDIDPRYKHILYDLNRNRTDQEAMQDFHVDLDGTIWTNATFNRENKTYYQLFITAYNNASFWNSMETPKQDFQLDVQVIGNNDKAPYLTNVPSMNRIPINETTANGTNIYNFTIIDPNRDTNLNLGIFSGNFRNTFTFTLVSDNTDNPSRTQYEGRGELKVVAPLDYQLRQNYHLVLFAFDTKHYVTINVTVSLIPQNTKAPYFDLFPNDDHYAYQVMENTVPAILDDPVIQAYDPDNTQSLLRYDIYDPRRQLDLTNLNLTQVDNRVTLHIIPPGLSRDLPFGSPVYTFAIAVTDENGTGVSSYVPVTIEIIDRNDKVPIPMSFSCINEGFNPSIPITFVDYDDPNANNTIPYRVDIVNSPNFSIYPALSFNNTFRLNYSGILNRTLTKNLTVTFNTSNTADFSQLTSVSIVVCDQFNQYPISAGSKTIEIIYVNGYENSLCNVELGSIYVQDLNDWFRAARDYSIRSVSNGQVFSASEGLLKTSEILYPGSYTVLVDVTKRTSIPESFALSTINLEVKNVDRENVRQASVIRIQGEYPHTLIDPILGSPLNKLHNALASLLSVDRNSILILSIRSVFQYQNPFDPPKPFDIQKNQTLTDVIFYVSSLNRFEVEQLLQRQINQLQLQSQIRVIAIAPDPCNNYRCPLDTCCRSTRTIQPKPFSIDSNLTSFVGINILESADCINRSYPLRLSDDCTILSSNNLSDGSLIPSNSAGISNEILGLTFDENVGGYGRYSGLTFSNFAPARFSFEFATRSPIRDGLILLYGRNIVNVDDFFWLAIEIQQSYLKFSFRDRILIANDTKLNASTWYHVECQFVQSTILVLINDWQYSVVLINNTININDLSSVELYLGGLPIDGSLVSALYPSLTRVSTFNGCIRNILSNGFYLNTAKSSLLVNATSGVCPCSVTNSCSITERASDVLVPWYIWLIMALVLLFLATIVIITVLICIKRRRKLQVVKGLYTDDTGEDSIAYKETDGEEDHSTYDLHVLRKPIYSVTDGKIGLSDGQSDYHDSRIYYREALGDYIEEKLNDQVIPYANDTQLHYYYEGQGSITSNLSSIESLSDKNHSTFPHSFEAKVINSADL